MHLQVAGCAVKPAAAWHQALPTLHVCEVALVLLSRHAHTQGHTCRTCWQRLTGAAPLRRSSTASFFFLAFYFTKMFT
jgi:hypothetical protein